MCYTSRRQNMFCLQVRQKRTTKICVSQFATDSLAIRLTFFSLTRISCERQLRESRNNKTEQRTHRRHQQRQKQQSEKLT